MSFTVIIPARYSSQRLPGKPLADIAGKPMIEYVYKCAQKSNASRVIVATDDQRVFEAVKEFGGEAFMTADSHESGTDRLQEVVQALGFGEDEIVVNVQGDEPLIPASVINQVAENLACHPKASAATLSGSIENIEAIFDENAVKVVTDNEGYALYFSRASIPWVRGEFSEENPQLPSGELAQRHIGIYAYKVGLLNQFVEWDASVLEQTEKLEQLRILSNGHRIHVAQSCDPVPGGVDTESDLKRVRELLKKVQRKL